MRRSAPTLIFFAAFFIRVICLYGAHHSDPVFFLPFVDSEHHFKEAMFLLTEGWQGPPIAYWKPPFYSYFLALFFKIFGGNFLLLRLFQIILGSLNCVLIYSLGKRLLGRKIGTAAGFIASLYGMFTYFDLQILVTPFTVTFTLMALISLLQAWDRPPSRWLVPGLWIGLTASTRAEILLFVPFVLLWIAGMPRSWPGKLKSSAILAVGIFIIILPITLRNYMITKDSVLISANGGINFFVANDISYDQASGMWLSFPMMWDRVKMAPEYKNITKESEMSSYYYTMAMKNIRRNPTGYLNTLGQKFNLFFNGYEISSNRNIYDFAAKISLLRALVWKSAHFAFPFGLIAPFGLVGFILAWKEKDKRNSHKLLFYFFLSSIISTLLFFNTARFRMALVPIYIIFAVYGFSRLTDWYRQKNKRVAITPTLLFLLFFLMVNGKIAQTKNMPPPDLMHLAIKYQSENNHPKAVETFLRVLDTHPDDLLLKHFLCRSYYADRQHRELLSTYQGMLYTSNIDPDWRRYIHEQLALNYMQMGKYQKAIDHYKIVLSLEPDQPIYQGKEFFVIHDEKFLYYRTLYNMAEAFYKKGDREEGWNLLAQIEKNGPDFFRKKAAEMLHKNNPMDML